MRREAERAGSGHAEVPPELAAERSERFVSGLFLAAKGFHCEVWRFCAAGLARY